MIALSGTVDCKLVLHVLPSTCVWYMQRLRLNCVWEELLPNHLMDPCPATSPESCGIVSGKGNDEL